MKIGRRKLLKKAAAAGAILSCPGVLRRAYAAEPLKVGSYGGYFEDSLREKLFPQFTRDTGIEVRSTPIPAGTAYFAGARAAVMAGDPPVDVAMTSGSERIRFKELFQPFSEGAVPNLANLAPDFIARDETGKPYAAAVLSWFATFVQNTEYFPDPIKSWREIWDPKFKNSLGWTEDITISALLEITAATFFKGQDMFASRDAVLTLMRKAAELKSNVTLWYRDEGQFQQGLQSGEIPAGQYYNDVARTMAADGFPIISVFPEEGGVVDFGSWAILQGSKNASAAEAFINYCCDPKVQGNISRSVGTAPVVSQKAAGLTDQEFEAISSAIPPVLIAYKFHVENVDWVTEQWAKVLAGG